MKSRLAVLVVALALFGVACGSGNPIATVGGSSITDEQVNGFHASGDAGGDFDCTLDFLIATELLIDAARTDLGVTVTGGDIDDYLEAPPQHRADTVATVVSEGRLSDAGLRAQARMWALSDQIIEARGGASGDGAVLDDWIAELVDSGALGDVVVDPLFGSWAVTDLSAGDACAGSVLATVGDLVISDRDVEALRAPGHPATAEEFDFELQFLISANLYLIEAEERFGITVSDEAVDAFLAAPPAHRVEALVQFQGLELFSDVGLRAQVRRWIVSDEVVVRLVRDEPDFLAALATNTGLPLEEVSADPLAYMQPDEAAQVFNAWTTEVAGEGGFAEVVVDPEIGSWDPVFRQFTRAGA